MPLVEIKNLTFSYEGISDVFSDISMAVKEGQSLLVVGDNGSGKTTLGCLLAGLIKPTKGIITIAGEKPSEVEIVRRCRLVSYMGQVNHLSVLTSSIAGELASFAQETESAAVEEAYKEWAVRHSLPTDTEINPRDLTTPDLWRLVLGFYTVVLQPRVLIVDEVFSASSKQQQNCIQDVLERRKRQQKVTIVLYQRMLPLLFDSVFTLTDGKMILALV